MIIIDLSMLELKPTIYIGKKERKYFDKQVELWGGDYIYSKDSDGLTCKWFSWVEDIKNHMVLFHEISHMIDNIIEEVYIEDDEFRACLTAYIITSVLQNKHVGE